jgi:sugar O-acyltransferase (sialic acid O-acetyltransferase NeuD family)
MKQIVLIGAGGHARVVWDTIELIRERSDWQVIAVLDDNPALWGKSFAMLTIDGPIQKIERMPADAALLAIGDNRARRDVYAQIQSSGIPFVNAIHPCTVIARDAQLGTGVVAFANVVVNPGSRIGDNVILNTACSVDHDCVIGAHAHIAPGVRLAGTVSVGEGTLMGIGSIAIPNVTIGEWVTVGAGSVVTQDMPARVTAVGVPARIIQRGENPR